MKRSGAQTIFSDVTLRFRGGVRSPSPEWKCSSVYLRNPFPNGEREREGERWAVLRLSRPSFTVKTRSVGTWTPAPLSSPAWRAPRQHRRNLGCVWTPAMAGRRSSVVSLWPPVFTQFNGRAWGAALEYISKDFTSQKGLNVMAWRTFLFEKFDLWTFFFFFSSLSSLPRRPRAVCEPVPPRLLEPRGQRGSRRLVLSGWVQHEAPQPDPGPARRHWGLWDCLADLNLQYTGT